jgi:hypothetical protein
MNTSIATKILKPARPRSIFWWIGRITAGLLVLIFAFAGYMIWHLNYVPADLDTSTTQSTTGGLYQVSYTPSSTPIPINQLHTWTLTVTTPDGQPLEGAHIQVDGDMPQHGHGLPTQPQVTQYLGDGQYLVEGVRFQMGGWWVMDVDVSAGGQSDTVRFNLVLTR